MREVRLFLKTKEWLAREDKLRDPGIHASDLLDTRYAYWNKKLPKEPTERMVWFFSIGKILHMLVLSAFTGESEGKTDSGSHRILDIAFSPDAHSEEGRPIELKTHRGLREPKDLQDSFGHYLEQLCIYLVLENRLEGELWVLFINLHDASGRTFPEPRCYKVMLTEEQFYGIEQQILAARDALSDALERSDPSGLKKCRDWKCGLNCVYWDSCKPEGRYPNTDRRRWPA